VCHTFFSAFVWFHPDCTSACHIILLCIGLDNGMHSFESWNECLVSSLHRLDSVDELEELNFIAMH